MKILVSTVHRDDRGRLEVVQGLRTQLKDFSRFFVLSDMAGNTVRGRHAHRTQTQAFFALAGSCILIIESKEGKKELLLGQDGNCYIVPPMTWVEICQFSPDCQLLVLSDGDYLEEDYIRDYRQFKHALNKG
jgi:hypothetical protein